MSNVDYDTADRTEVANTFKTKAVAERHTREYAGMMSLDGEQREPGEVFAFNHWTGQKYVPAWAAYDLAKVDGTWVISSYSWYTDPSIEPEARGPKPGDLCYYDGPEEARVVVHHETCDQHPAGTRTDVRTGRVVK